MEAWLNGPVTQTDAAFLLVALAVVLVVRDVRSRLRGQRR